ncbi:MAG: hypothetical protein GX323_09860 [Clostridiales bacterium]|nr:hypothetical protein [Clostridiales bacterium]
MIRKKGVRFSDKKHSIKGIISLAMGIISLILLIVLFYLSARASGSGGMVIGYMGVAILITSIIGAFLAYQAYKERDVYYNLPLTGLIINLLIFLTLFVLYIVGLVM